MRYNLRIRSLGEVNEIATKMTITQARYNCEQIRDYDNEAKTHPSALERYLANVAFVHVAETDDMAYLLDEWINPEGPNGVNVIGILGLYGVVARGTLIVQGKEALMTEALTMSLGRTCASARYWATKTLLSLYCAKLMHDPKTVAVALGAARLKEQDKSVQRAMTSLIRILAS